MTQAKIVILGTGGTIAGQAQSCTQGLGYKVGQLSIASLLAAVPDLPQLAAGSAGAVLQAVQLSQIDSKDMDWAVWRSLLQAVQSLLEEVDTRALVITHGTDTLEETAWLLQAVLQPAKPVVLTCAMRPATSLQADGPQNLRDAVAVAAGDMPGVWVVAAGEVHAARQVSKAHPYRLNALRSYEGGPRAYVEEGYVRWLARMETPYHPWSAARRQQLLGCAELPWVEVVQSGALQSGLAIGALVGAGVRGLVVAGTGNGTVHQAMEQALQQAQAQGVEIWCSTRCLEGRLVGWGIAQPGDADDEIEAHLVRADDASRLTAVLLPPSKARIAMMLSLACS